MKEELKVVGRGIPLKDGAEKVTGKAKYSADIKLSGMLHAKILGSPHPHAKIKRIDTRKALKIEGVVDIITHEDVPKILFHPHETKPMYVLDEELRYVGEPVAVVAAETEEIADQALEAINVDYEVLPAVFDPIEGMKADAPKMYPEGNTAHAQTEKWGDPGKAIKEADVVVEGTFKTPIQVEAPIEPRACIANWDGKELCAWVSTQFPHRVREDLATVLSLPLNQVKVVHHYIGGGFGGKKQEEYPFMPALLSMRTNRPVKLEFDRDTETLVGRRRYSSTQKVKLAAKKDGTITAIDFEAYYDVGAHGSFVGGSLALLLSQFYVYRFENAAFTVYDVNTNLPTAQPFRSVQFPAYHFALEQLVDQVAEKVGLDPMEVRLKNTYRTGAETKPYGAKLSNFAVEECTDRALEASGFMDKWKGWDKPVESTGSKRRGIGVGLGMGWSGWMKDRSAATVKINPDGTAELITGATDLGTGANTTLSQVAAEELGIDLERLKTTTGDTALTPDDYGSCGSRTLHSAGLAIRGAAQDAKKRLIDTVALTMKTKKESVEYKDGQLYITGAKRALSEVITEPVVGAYHNKPEKTVAPFHPALYVGPALFHVAEVEVDVETGEVRVLKYVAAQDVGRAINPTVVEGQIYGAALQGMGYSLKEELLFDRDSGKVLNPNFLDYKVFNPQDAPNVEVAIVESHDPNGPFGAVGVGEHGLTPVAGTVANAVYNAIGIRMHEIPITPERVLKALGKI
ncbi:MAG: molybdopterin-dependent oxidoreductase [Proteobacteria bacterium]|nr:molybdopterin-dependent oxidoreductase [Pseudomonadota bacterium]